jgi:hypothetical protein
MSYPYGYASPAFSGAPLYSTSLLPVSGALQSYPTATLQSYPLMSTGFVSAPEVSYSSGYSEAIVPMGNLPQPSPPADWVLTKADSTVKQTSTAVLYNYEYSFTPPSDKTTPAIPAPSKITAPIVPASWTIDVEKLVIENKEKSLTYKYELSYFEKGSTGISDAAKKKADDDKKKLQEKKEKEALDKAVDEALKSDAFRAALADRAKKEGK